jgi:type VI secretion system FHA domain protein
MTLTLTINGLDRLENGEAARLRLDRHGARIGRSAHMDWSLPDPRSYISSSHCEIEYRDGGYLLVDRSTNGTYVNRSPSRLTAPHRIADGDVIQIGHYEVLARVEGEGQADLGAQAAPAWQGWTSQVPAGAEPVGIDAASWDRPAPQPAISGLGSGAASWTPPKVGAPAASAWAQPETPALEPSAWSSGPQAAADPSGGDIWGQLASTNEVDWSRGGFGAPSPAPSAAPAAAAPGAAPAASGWGSPEPSAGASAWGAPAAAEPAEAASEAAAWGAPQPPAAAAFGAPAVAPSPPAPSAAPALNGAGLSSADWAAFLAGAGLQPGDVKSSPGQALGAAGAALRRLVAGMVVLLEARARAKSQLGAANTSLEFAGNNPLKFARTPEKALAQLLDPPERGFMPSERAVEDAFCDLQAHQMATLAAMQGALQATLARFSPQAIRGRAETRGLLAKILPSARDATLWQVYEREFEGVAKGSDEAFMDVFAKEFRTAYERVAAEMKAKRSS